MADKGIKNIIISKNNLPAVGESNNHVVRYRIISEDRNRTSHWSPTYNLTGHAPAQVAGAVDITTKTLTAVWEDSTEYDDREAYDVFIKVDNGNWEYRGTTYTHSFTMILPSSGSEISVAVQIESYVKTRNESLTIFQDTESLI